MNQFISCKCITYGRVNLLEEALYSFLQQDYPKDRCELIIVNDYPKQKLIYNAPNVKIFNLDETFLTIGEKENFATKQCSGNIICQWDDDDIALPHHLKNVNELFDENKDDILQWNRAVFFNNLQITAITGVGNSGIVFNKKTWEKIGGHPLENAGYDMTFVNKLRSLGNIVIASPEKPSWFYMWGGRGYHQSGMGTDDGSRPNVIQRHSAHVEMLRAKGEIPTGDVRLHPYWKQNYSKLLEEYVTKNKSLHN